MIAYCVAAADVDALRMLVRLLRSSGKKLDRETERALETATKELDVGESFFCVR